MLLAASYYGSCLVPRDDSVACASVRELRQLFVAERNKTSEQSRFQTLYLLPCIVVASRCQEMLNGELDVIAGHSVRLTVTFYYCVAQSEKKSVEVRFELNSVRSAQSLAGC